MKKALYTVLLSLLMFLSACGGPKVITIGAVGNEMKFDKTSFTVNAGEKIRLVMDNKATMAAMKHNVVVLTDKEAINRVGQAALTAQDYLPSDPAIIAATPVADIGQKTQVEFTAPNTPGEYPFICTFAGHYLAMQGVMIVE